MFIPGIWFCTIVFPLKLTWQLITINVFSFFKYKIQLTRSMSETSDLYILRNSRLAPDLISFWNCCPSRIIPFDISRLFSVLQWMTILRSPSTLIPFMVDPIFSVVRNFKSHIYNLLNYQNIKEQSLIHSFDKIDATFRTVQTFPSVNWVWATFNTVSGLNFSNL
jgi:hypothetical protein